MVHIDAQFGSAGTIKTLQNIIEKRMQFMRETSRDSIAASAIDVLRSLRTVTKVAKPSTLKVDVTKEGCLYPSITSVGGHKKLCLRITGTKQRYLGNETMVGLEKMPLKNQHVYRFEDTHKDKTRKYLIIAPSMAQAKAKAKAIKRKRGMRFAGLAKRALGILMFKTNTKRVNDGALNPLVENVADEVTKVNERTQTNGDGGIYTLTLVDDLKYALLAVKGGCGALEGQIKKAANKIVSVVNQRIKGSDFLGAEKIPTPFPEVRQRRTK